MNKKKAGTHSRAERLFDLLIVRGLGWIIYHLFPIIGTVITFTLVCCFLGLIPLFLLYILRHAVHFEPGPELETYLIMSILSIMITFASGSFNDWSGRYIVDNEPRDLGLTGRLFREPLLKPVFYGINLILIAVSTTLKYQHLKFMGLSDTGMDPFVQSFVTFIAFDALVTSARAAKAKRTAA